MNGIKSRQNNKTYRNVFVSLPMRDRDVDEIGRRQRDILERLCPPEDALINNIHEALCPPDDNFLWYLGLSIQQLGEADLVIFASDWREARGCRVEHAVCELYKIPYVYESLENRYADDK